MPSNPFLRRLASRARLAALVCAVAPAWSRAALRAQGVAGAAIQGTVERASGASMQNVRVALIDPSTGYRRNTVTGGHGSFTFENVPVGGPYMLEARAIGFAPESIPGIMLHLGDRFSRRLVLAELVQRLADVIVRDDALRDAGAGGPVHDVPGDAVRSLPLRNRDFVGLLAMAPQATGSPNLSISGQHTRLNAIQVDGGSASDFLGLDVTPGAGVGARALSLEALRELRILIAPFDVRQGGFTGGLINAVTRSGTNQFQGSTFVSMARNDLVGLDTGANHIDPFTTLQYGLSAGGPIIRDRLHFFVVADVQSAQTPAPGLASNDPTVGASDSLASRIAQIIRDRYGFDPGGAEVPLLRQPNRTFFTKLSWQPSSTHLIELTNNFSDARSGALARGVTGLARDGWQLSRGGAETRVRNVTTRIKATSTFGAVSNELIASVATANTDIGSVTRTPIFIVATGPLPVAAGATRNAENTTTDERIVEMTDDATWSRGDHLFTAGVQNQFLHIVDNFFLNSWGAWTFADTTALAQGTAQRFDRAVTLPSRPEGPLANYSPYQLAGYVQDRWTATPHLTVTGGLRVDAPFLGAPRANPALLTDAALGNIDTHRLPSGHAVLSPRLEFAYDVGPERDWLLRGGAGGFAGHPPYVYVNGAYANTGQEQATLTCTAANGVPQPTIDVDNLPTQCLNGAGTLPLKSVTIFAPDFRFPQAVKYDVGLEHDVGRGMTASMDVIHTRTRNATFMRDVNLVEVGTGTEGRVMYGRIAARGAGVSVSPTRLDSVGFGPVYRYENRSADRSTSLTLELQKKWTAGLVQLGYNWSRSEDVMSMSGNQGLNTMTSNPIDGSMTSRRLRRSARDIPRNFVATAVVPAAFGVTASGFFRVRSGTPYSYVAAGDPNADGFANDLAYIPRDSLDINLAQPASYSALDAFIKSEACLRDQRGHVMARNSCRNPAVTSLDMRFAKRLRLATARGAEIGVDVFNFLNLLRRDWGLVRETSTAEGVTLMTMTGWDAVAGRPQYTLKGGLPSRGHVVSDVSRWRMQLSARFDY